MFSLTHQGYEGALSAIILCEIIYIILRVGSTQTLQQHQDLVLLSG